MATYYIKNGGNNSLDGLSDGNAWETIGKINSYGTSPGFLPGDTICFKCGDIWNTGTLNIYNSGTDGNPITFTSYSTGDKPIISTFGELTGWDTSGNWSEYSTNIWRWLRSRIRRLWIDGTEVKKSETIAVTETAPWKWDVVNLDYLYVYSVGNPATNFSNMETSGGITSIALESTNTNHIVIDNLDVQGAGHTIRLKAVHDWEIKNCNIGYNSTVYGILLFSYPEVNPSYNVFIHDNTFDTNYKIMLDWIDDSAYDDSEITVDGVLIKECYDCKVYDNTFIDWCHTAVAIESLTAGFYTENNEVYNNYMTAPDVYYGRGFGVAVSTGLGSGNKVYNNYIYDCPTQNQLECPYLEFYNNIIDTVRGSGVDKPEIGKGIQFAGSTGATNNMKIYNNIIMNCNDWGMGITAGETDKTECEIINNIFYNNNSTNGVQLWVQTDSQTYANIYKNNLFYKSGVTDLVAMCTWTNRYNATYQSTVAEFNAMNGNLGNVISNNINGDPLFEDVESFDYNITNDSPAKQAGIDVGLDFDHIGNLWSNPPSIGAFEFIYNIVSGYINRYGIA